MANRKERAQRSARRLSAIVDHMADAAFTVARDGAITSSSPSAERLFGTIVGRSVELLLPGEEPAEVLVRAWQGVGAQRHAATALAADGRRVDLELALVPLYEREEIVEVLVIARDVTDLLVLGAERRAAVDRLERLAIMRRRLVAQGLEHQERERRDLSLRLHDEALQYLLAARQDLEEALAGTDAEALIRARKSLDAATRELRGAVSDLHPATLEHAGLEAALQRLVADLGKRAGFVFTVEIDPAAEGIADQIVLSLARELVRNAANHARPTLVTCSLTLRGRQLELVVRDDGSGFAVERLPEAVRAGHIGLASLLERVEDAGGSADIDSREGAGTQVRILLPVGGDQASPADAPLGASDRGVV